MLDRNQKDKNTQERKAIMALKVERVDAWAAPLEDKPGSLAAKLAALADAGINLEYLQGM